MAKKPAARKAKPKRRLSFKKAAQQPQTGPWLIEVAYRSQRYDPAGNALAKAIKDADAKAVLKPRVSHLYMLDANLNQKDAELAAREILEDPIIQTSEVFSLEKARAAKFKAPVVDVWLKPGVTDVVAETLQQGLKDFNIEDARARSGTRYSFPGLKDAEILKTIAKNFLMNPLIHEYYIQSPNA
jgi:phosphoribosylformylglycinamidine (FGAM) synthase PurS component